MIEWWQINKEAGLANDDTVVQYSSTVERTQWPEVHLTKSCQQIINDNIVVNNNENPDDDTIFACVFCVCKLRVIATLELFGLKKSLSSFKYCRQYSSNKNIQYVYHKLLSYC